MIRRISRLTDIGRFKSLASDSGTQGDFAKFNVIYALNACGKSTLCDIFRSLHTQNPDYIKGRARFSDNAQPTVELLFDAPSPTPKAIYDSGNWKLQPSGFSQPRCLVYDERFVADSIHIGTHITKDHRKRLFELVLGETANVLRSEVEAAEKNLNEASNELATAKQLLQQRLPANFDIHSFGTLSTDERIEEKINETMKELDRARTVLTNAKAIQSRRPLAALVIPEIPTVVEKILSASLDELTASAEQRVRNHIQQHSSGTISTDWIRKGYEAIRDEFCPFCAQTVGNLEIIKVYSAFFSDALTQQRNDQKRLLDLTEERFGSTAKSALQQTLQSHVTEKEWWMAAAGHRLELPELPSPDTITRTMELLRFTISQNIRDKMQQPSIPIPLSEDTIGCIEAWRALVHEFEAYNLAIHNHNELLPELQTTVIPNEVKELEQKLELLKAQKVRAEQTTIEAYERFEKAQEAHSKKQKEKTKANSNLHNESKELFDKYGKRVNEILKEFAASFEVVNDGIDFRGGASGKLSISILGKKVDLGSDKPPTSDVPSLLNTLSGGDRSALAFALFIAVAEQDPNLGSSILIFDDPYHNQDRSRRQRTMEYIKSLAKRCKQCFILSHDLDFAMAISKSEPATKTFVLDALRSPCRLQANPLPQLPAASYEADYRRVYEFAHEPRSDTDSCVSVIRSLRQVLEGYLRCKFPQAWGENQWLGDMISAIRASSPSDLLQYCSARLNDLESLNDYCKAFYHSDGARTESSDVDPRELANYCERALKLISS